MLIVCLLFDGVMFVMLVVDMFVDVECKIDVVYDVFFKWCMVLVLVCGEFVCVFGNVLCEYKVELGCFVMFEVGKIMLEGFGEV